MINDASNKSLPMDKMFSFLKRRTIGLALRKYYN